MMKIVINCWFKAFYYYWNSWDPWGSDHLRWSNILQKKHTEIGKIMSSVIFSRVAFSVFSVVHFQMKMGVLPNKTIYCIFVFSFRVLNRRMMWCTLVSSTDVNSIIMNWMFPQWCSDHSQYTCTHGDYCNKAV